MKGVDNPWLPDAGEVGFHLRQALSDPYKTDGFLQNMGRLKFDARPSCGIVLNRTANPSVQSEAA